MLSKMSRFATNTFLVWMLIAAILGFIFPAQLATLGSWVPYLLGIVMLGMGLTIDPKDFKIVFQAPKSVLFGVFLQYSIMPLMAYLIRSEEHTSELQSRFDLVCRLLLEKKYR